MPVSREGVNEKVSLLCLIIMASTFSCREFDIFMPDEVRARCSSKHIDNAMMGSPVEEGSLTHSAIFVRGLFI